MDSKQEEKLSPEEMREKRLQALEKQEKAIEVMQDEEEGKDEEEEQEEEAEMAHITIPMDPDVFTSTKGLMWPSYAGDDDILRWHSQGFRCVSFHVSSHCFSVPSFSVS